MVPNIVMGSIYDHLGPHHGITISTVACTRQQVKMFHEFNIIVLPYGNPNLHVKYLNYFEIQKELGRVDLAMPAKHFL